MQNYEFNWYYFALAIACLLVVRVMWGYLTPRTLKDDE